MNSHGSIEGKEKTGSYSNTELFALAVAGEKIDPMRVVATYADPKNWGKMNDPSYGCRWYWKGPVICAFELASWVKLEPPAKEE